MKKGIVRYLAIMLMVASVFSATSWVYASSNSIGVLEKEFNDRYQDVSYKEIHKSANLALSYNVNEKSNVEIGYDFIPLETLDGERYAFLIPIIDGGQLTGYMVMGAIDNNYLMLELSVFQPDFTKYIIGASQKSALVYMFPSVFITNTGKEYFLISEDLKQIDITNSLPAPSTRVLDFLRNLPEPDHLPQSIPESVGLANWEEFVPIFHEDNPPVYGGWQDWLGPNEYHGYGYVSQFQADRSCGVTAAANGAYHMSVYKAGMGNLYNRPNLSREEFTGHMYSVYQHITPGFAGIPDIPTMVSGFQAFGLSRNVNLNPVWNNQPWNIENVSNYIKSGLTINSPVLLLSWNATEPSLRYHWVTITRYYLSASSHRYFTCSNWGQQRVYSLDIWVADGPSFGPGVIYFN